MDPKALTNQRSKPHIIIVCEKWCDAIPHHGLSPSQHSFWGPLESSQVASHTLFHFDEYFDLNGKAGDEALLSRCKEEKPDLVFLIWLYSERSHVNPKIETLYEIRENLKIPVVAWWGDSHADFLRSLAELLAPYFDYSLVGDSARASINKIKNPDRFFPLPHPKDPRIFFDPEIERDIDVSFIGTLRGDRQARLERLKALGLNIFHTGGQRESKLSIDEYASFFQRSKMTISFSQFNGQEIEIINGRVFEAPLCGALLLAPSKSDTASWYQPNLDYVPYDNDTDLVNKVSYYLNHPQERCAIAAHGKATAQKNYTGEKFWKKVIELATAQSKYDQNYARLGLARYYFQFDKFGPCQELLRQIPTNSPAQGESFYLQGELALAQGKRDLAIEYFTQAVNFAGDDSKLIANCAEQFLSLSENELAQTTLLRALSKFNNSPELLAIFCRLPSSANQKGEILEVLSNLVSTYPNHFEIQLLVAEMLHNLGFRAEADEIIKSAEKIAPSKDTFHLEVAKLQHRWGDIKEARKHAWLAVEPNDRSVHAWHVLPKVINLEYEGRLKAALETLTLHMAHVTIEPELLRQKYVDLAKRLSHGSGESPDK